LLTPMDVPVNLYDLHLGLGDKENIAPIPFPAGRLALSIDATGQFAVADQSASLARLLEQERPAEAVPLDVTFGGLIQLAGYEFEPVNWKSGQTNNLLLYWQPLQEPDLGLAGAFELVLKLSTQGATEPVLISTQPVFPNLTTTGTLKRGEVVPIQYPVSVPTALPAGNFLLDICLTMSANGQPVAGTVSSTSEPVECLSLPVTIESP